MESKSVKESNRDAHRANGREPQCSIEPLSALARLLARQAASDQFLQQSDEGKHGTEPTKE